MLDKFIVQTVAKEVEKQLTNRHIASKGYVLTEAARILSQKFSELSNLEKRLDSQQKQINKLFAIIEQQREEKEKPDYSAFVVDSLMENFYWIVKEDAGDFYYIHKNGAVKKYCGKKNFFSSKQEAQDFLDELQGKTGKPKLPRVGQLCYVWDVKGKPEIPVAAQFMRFSDEGRYEDQHELDWNYWSFIPVEDIL